MELLKSWKFVCHNGRGVTCISRGQQQNMVGFKGPQGSAGGQVGSTILVQSDSTVGTLAGKAVLASLARCIY